jgi:hypothetical protein
MSISLLQSLVVNGDRIKEDIWRHDGSELAIGQFRKITSELQTQLEVQEVLLSTAKLLRCHLSDKQLPNQQAIRVKHFVKFVFERATRANVKDKQFRLQELDCTSLKLCGLSYVVKELVDMPSRLFDFLVAKLPSFAELHDLSLLLCRDDINKIIRGDFDPEDETKFAAFLLGRSHSATGRSRY